MSKTGQSTLTRINTESGEKISKLLYLKDEMDYNDTLFLYSVAISLINEFEKYPAKSLYIEFAYYIIFKTCLKTGSYSALFDFCVNYGYYPIAFKIIDLNLLDGNTWNTHYSQLQLVDFVENGQVLTYEQKAKFNLMVNSKADKIGFIAPTSYGKSRIIFEHLRNNSNLTNAAIIVPTKSLIEQVSSDAIEHVEDRKLIVHDQNFSSRDSTDIKTLSIVTQERALRLLDKGMKFDVLYIDEAHEIFDFNFRNKYNNRSILLSRVIRTSRKKNTGLKEIYLSPLIEKVMNLKIEEDDHIEEHRIKHNLKIMDIKYLNSDSQLFSYNRYLGKFVNLKNDKVHFEYIKDSSLEKNLFYLYRPSEIEKFSAQLYDNLSTDSDFIIPHEVRNLMDELEMLIHPMFKGINYLSVGIIYIHGKIPTRIKNYLVYCFKTIHHLKYFVANNVILAGMNLPIDNLFYINGNSNINSLTNLIGRVNRLNEIFSKQNKDLRKVLVPVHFLEFHDFEQYQKLPLDDKIIKLRKTDIIDTIKNPVLPNSKVEKGNQDFADIIKMNENNIINEVNKNSILSILTKSGAQSLLNYEENKLCKIENKILNLKYKKEDNLLKLVRYVFFEDMEIENDFNPNDSIKRLRFIETINYYNHFISNSIKYNLSERIECKRLIQYMFEIYKSIERRLLQSI